MLTAEKLREGVMGLAQIPTPRLLIEYRAATGELKDLMAMELEERHVRGEINMGRGK